MIFENYCKVKESISKCCTDCGRNPEDVLLLAVSKRKSAENILELYGHGHRDFGENYVQELCEKHEKLPKDINWHMIGHLQTNKVKYIAPFVSLIHSVDSYKLASVIDKEAKKNNRIIPILIQVNVALEDTKFGINSDEVISLYEEIRKLENVRIEGLMTSAPYVENPEEDRYVFRKLRDLSLDIHNKFQDNYVLKFLSMGMSNDYFIAISEGSTLVRVGTDIFGERVY